MTRCETTFGPDACLLQYRFGSSYLLGSLRDDNVGLPTVHFPSRAVSVVSMLPKGLGSAG
jgi:hypothetical protein